MRAISVSAESKKWQIERDLETVMDAERIKKDKTRMAAVKKLAKEKAEQLEETLDTEPGDKD